MYGQGSTPLPIVAGVGTGAVLLPTSGANVMVTIATAVFVGLIAWGVVYYYRTVRG